MSAVRNPPTAWRHRYAVFVSCCTFLLIIAGGLVTSTGSGLAVPDWPLSFGQVFPRMEGGVLFEHGHRMVATFVGFLTVILAVWTARAEQRAWVRRLGWAMLAAVIVQGVLGGMTVLMKLPDAVSVSHAGLAQIFFSLTVIMASVTSPRFTGAPGKVRAPSSTPALATIAVLIVYAQILLGAIVRHTGAGLAIPDFPLAFGRLVPPLTNHLVAWHFAHRIGAVLVVAVIGWTFARIVRSHRDEPWLVGPATLLLAVTAFQVFLGGLTIWTGRAIVPTTAHVATGALLLVMTVLIAVRSHRLFPAAAHPPISGMVPEPAPQ